MRDELCDDDDDWLALIAGRPRPDADAATRANASLLRAAFLTYQPEAPAGQASEHGQRLDRLLQRGRQAGVLAAATPAWRVRLRAWWQRPQGLALAFSLLLGAGMVVMWQGSQPPEASQERGASASQHITASDPVQRQRELLAALRGAGLEAAPFERLGRLGIDVSLPPELSPTQRQVLAAQGLAVPLGPVLVIEILTASRP